MAQSEAGNPLSEDQVQQARRRPKRSRGTRTALVVTLGIVLLLVAGVAGAALFVQSRINAGIERIDDPFAGLTDRPAHPEPTAAGDEQPVNILILGSDSRISAGDPSQWQAGAQRTDAIMIAQVSGDRQNAFVMSIPRDSWVDVPGHGMNKINAAFSFGGPTLMIQTVEQLTGIPIDHFAIADFESFATLTDELGGVEITLPNGMDSGGVVLEPGTHLLDGEQALAYARQRYDVPGGDFGRVQRQQNWIRGIMQAAFREDVLTDPGRLMSFLQSVTRTVAVDDGFTIGDMTSLALSMRDIRPPDVTFMTAPNAGTGRSPDGAQSIVLLDDARFGALSNAFAADNVANYLEVNPGAVATLGEDVN
ncbi:LCP family protein [Georgenia sp. AZ-5]|uniref:LCP family protein n=1 Tax=Georgenia sp. AZ-5 TaxID=3367526 RepID=UPI003754F392